MKVLLDSKRCAFAADRPPSAWAACGDDQPCQTRNLPCAAQCRAPPPSHRPRHRAWGCRPRTDGGTGADGTGGHSDWPGCWLLAVEAQVRIESDHANVHPRLAKLPVEVAALEPRLFQGLVGELTRLKWWWWWRRLRVTAFCAFSARRSVTDARSPCGCCSSGWVAKPLPTKNPSWQSRRFGPLANHRLRRRGIACRSDDRPTTEWVDVARGQRAGDVAAQLPEHCSCSAGVW